MHGGIRRNRSRRSKALDVKHVDLSQDVGSDDESHERCDTRCSSAISITIGQSESMDSKLDGEVHDMESRHGDEDTLLGSIRTSESSRSKRARKLRARAATNGVCRKRTRSRRGVAVDEEDMDFSGQVFSDDESHERCDGRHPSTVSIDIISLAQLYPSAAVEEIKHCSMCDDDEPEEAWMFDQPSICNEYEALGTQVHTFKESEKTSFVDCEAELEGDSLGSQGTDMPSTGSSDHDWFPHGRIRSFQIPSVPTVPADE